MTNPVVKSRIRIRRVTDIELGKLPKKVLSNFRALSRPHVAEELERIEYRIREAHIRQGTGLGPRMIHFGHSLESVEALRPIGPECGDECLFVDSIEASRAKGEKELDRETVATA